VTTSYAPSLKVKAQAELELRDRQRRALRELRALPLTTFAARTQIEVPNGTDVAHVPFVPWPAQADVLHVMDSERLVVFLKARQIGVSWLACLYALRMCTLYPGQPVLCLSRGQLEANELVHRISFMHHHHHDIALLPRLVADNTADLTWANDSSVISLAATRNAGRSLTAALAILDEWAFMAWPRQTLAAVKPTIDAGGKLFIISSADGQGSAYHQFWQHAQAGLNGYKAVFLPWFAHPDRGDGWREQKIVEASGDTASVLREYPANDLEAFTAAAGLVYDVWSDGPPDGNVTEDAEYQESAGEILYAIDDGYAGQLDPQTGQYTADSHPRVFLLCQLRSDGSLNIFQEHYAIRTLSDQHIETVLSLPYPVPTYAAVDKSAAELKARLRAANMYIQNSPSNVEETIKEMRRWIAPDANGVRRMRVHPRCKHFRFEMSAYRYGEDQRPIKQHDHGPDAARYLCHTMRHS
jgi:terminase large subunit-like protein